MYANQTTNQFQTGAAGRVTRARKAQTRITSVGTAARARNKRKASLPRTKTASAAPLSRQLSTPAQRPVLKSIQDPNHSLDAKYQRLETSLNSANARLASLQASIAEEEDYYTKYSVGFEKMVREERGKLEDANDTVQMLRCVALDAGLGHLLKLPKRVLREMKGEGLVPPVTAFAGTNNSQGICPPDAPLQPILCDKYPEKYENAHEVTEQQFSGVKTASMKERKRRREEEREEEEVMSAARNKPKRAKGMKPSWTTETEFKQKRIGEMTAELASLEARCNTLEAQLSEYPAKIESATEKYGPSFCQLRDQHNEAVLEAARLTKILEAAGVNAALAAMPDPSSASACISDLNNYNTSSGETRNEVSSRNVGTAAMDAASYTAAVIRKAAGCSFSIFSPYPAFDGPLDEEMADNFA